MHRGAQLGEHQSPRGRASATVAAEVVRQNLLQLGELGLPLLQVLGVSAGAGDQLDGVPELLGGDHAVLGLDVALAEPFGLHHTETP